MPKKLSIIIVTYYTGDAVFAAIAAAMEQTAFEIIVVDNGNDDDTRCRLTQMALDNESLNYILNQENIGFGAACNKGAKAAKGEILIFLNPDTRLEANALVEMSRVMPNQIMGGLIKDENGKEQRGARRNELTLKTAILAFLGIRDDFNLDHTPLPLEIIPVANISGAFFAINNADFKTLKGFDEGYFLHVEDIDICTRLRKSGGQVVFNPRAQAFHIGGSSKALKTRVEFHKFMGFARFFWKNGDPIGRVDFLLIAPFLFVAMMARALIAQKRD